MRKFEIDSKRMSATYSKKEKREKDNKTKQQKGRKTKIDSKAERCTYTR